MLLTAESVVLRTCEQAFDWSAAALGGAAAVAIGLLILGAVLVHTNRRSW
jgi:hypothetical protein